MSGRAEKNGRTGEDGAAAETSGVHFDKDQSAMPTTAHKPSFEELRHHIEKGDDLVPLKPRSKLPLRKGWLVDKRLTPEEARAHIERGGNIGVRLRDDQLVVDVDPRNGGLESFKRLCELFPLPVTRAVVTGGDPQGRGTHHYLTKPAGITLVKILKGFPGVEFISKGGQVVAAGSVHPDTGLPYRWDPICDGGTGTSEVPTGLLDALRGDSRKPSSTEADDAPPLFEPDKIEPMLNVLDPADFANNGSWVELAMGFHEVTGGGGEEQFLAWSAGDPAYAECEEANRRRWRSFSTKKAGPRVGAGTLQRIFREKGHPEVADLIAKAVMDRDFADLPPEAKATSDEWVWVAGPKQFVRRSDCRRMDPMQWKSLHAHQWEKGDVLTAVWRGKLPVRKFEVLDFLPGEPEFPEGEDGPVYNVWRSGGVEPTPGDVDLFLEHMQYLFPDEVERGYVLDYLAHLVQHRGRKAHFALLIRGEQGTGKSWIGRLMGVLLGDRNVSRPSNDEVTGRWNAWMVGAELAVIEELMMLGRLEVANRLKSVITEPTARIEEKGANLYTISNHLNLLCFTNHSDAVKIERGDRRWLVVNSEAEPRDVDYYERLFGLLQAPSAAAIKAWLMGRTIGLNLKGPAPMTSAKDEMRRVNLSDAEAWVLAQLESRQDPFHCELFTIDQVIAKIPDGLRGSCRNLRNAISVLVAEHGAKRHERNTGKGRPSMTLWSVDNHGHWEALGPTKRADAYLEVYPLD